MIIDDLFELVSYRIASDPHIRINRDACLGCDHRACTTMCPARCYQWNTERSRVDFAYEACLECGTCLLVCDRAALEWHYPKGGFGVRFRLT
ncbi:MAG: 4Fe-4S dicluster domain-containing protein [Syntrophorhabdales bacterium]|jgi:ferredoxin like protein